MPRYYTAVGVLQPKQDKTLQEKNLETIQKNPEKKNVPNPLDYYYKSTSSTTKKAVEEECNGECKFKKQLTHERNKNRHLMEKEKSIKDKEAKLRSREEECNKRSLALTVALNATEIQEKEFILTKKRFREATQGWAEEKAKTIKLTHEIKALKEMLEEKEKEIEKVIQFEQCYICYNPCDTPIPCGNINCKERLCSTCLVQQFKTNVEQIYSRQETYWIVINQEQLLFPRNFTCFHCRGLRKRVADWGADESWFHKGINWILSARKEMRENYMERVKASALEAEIKIGRILLKQAQMDDSVETYEDHRIDDCCLLCRTQKDFTRRELINHLKRHEELALG